jgi:predicted dehydrogenase
LTVTSPIGIGIIGASPKRGWAVDAHLPAIAASPDFALRAASTSRRETAEEAARVFSVPAYDNHHELVARQDVDLVVVTVKVPHHFELVTAALDAGKAVLCEWPLGNGLDETTKLAEKASAAAVGNFVGLQARSSPGFNHVRKLIHDGFVGEVLSTTIVGSGANWGPGVEPENAYILDQAAGASMLMIPFGHAIDGICYCLGEVRQLSAQTASRRKSATIYGTDTVVPITVADQVLVAATLNSGATLSAHYRGGMSAGTNFLWEINGTEGDLVITAAHGVVEMTELSVSGARKGEPLAPMATPEDCRWAPSGISEGVAYNVAQAYARIAQDLRDGGCRAPRFEHAALRHHMLAAIEESARTGERQHLS